MCTLIVVAEAVKQKMAAILLSTPMVKKDWWYRKLFSEEIMKSTDIECRVTSLGHVQRGAPPTPRDRILASAFGVYAVDLIAKGKFGRMVAWKDRKVVDVPISEGISTYKVVDRSDPQLKLL